jgi:hypothetical protein
LLSDGTDVWRSLNPVELPKRFRYSLMRFNFFNQEIITYAQLRLSLLNKIGIRCEYLQPEINIASELTYNKLLEKKSYIDLNSETKISYDERLLIFLQSINNNSNFTTNKFLETLSLEQIEIFNKTSVDPMQYSEQEEIYPGRIITDYEQYILGCINALKDLLLFRNNNNVNVVDKTLTTGIFVCKTDLWQKVCNLAQIADPNLPTVSMMNIVDSPLLNKPLDNLEHYYAVINELVKIDPNLSKSYLKKQPALLTEIVTIQEFAEVTHYLPQLKEEIQLLRLQQALAKNNNHSIEIVAEDLERLINFLPANEHYYQKLVTALCNLKGIEIYNHFSSLWEFEFTSLKLIIDNPLSLAMCINKLKTPCQVSIWTNILEYNPSNEFGHSFVIYLDLPEQSSYIGAYALDINEDDMNTFLTNIPRDILELLYEKINASGYVINLNSTLLPYIKDIEPYNKPQQESTTTLNSSILWLQPTNSTHGANKTENTSPKEELTLRPRKTFPI